MVVIILEMFDIKPVAHWRIFVCLFNFGWFYGATTHHMSYGAEDTFESANGIENNSCEKHTLVCTLLTRLYDCELLVRLMAFYDI